MKRHWITAAVLLLLDGFVLGQAALTVLVTACMLVSTLVDLVIGLFGHRERALRGLRKAGIYLTLTAVVAAWLWLNARVAQKRAEELVVALESYHVTHGDYPTSLAGLVPDYVSSVPRARFTLAGARFFYQYLPDKKTGFLGYTQYPPFGRRVYSLQTRTWGGLD